MKALIMALPLLCAAGVAHADAAGDLKEALRRLPGTTDFAGTLAVEMHHTSGQGKDAREHSGSLGLKVEDGAAGLRLTYPRDVVARLDAESLARERDPKAPAATVAGAASITTLDVRSMIGSAEALSQLLVRSTLTGESAAELDGAKVRVLHFSTGLAPDLDEKQRQYVKDHTGTLDVTLGADGVPLASRLQDSITGRAFLVVSFKLGTIQDCIYAKAGDRLVTTRRETQTSYEQGSDVQNRRVLLTLEAAR
jgi:hypothetical protein